MNTNSNTNQKEVVDVDQLEELENLEKDLEITPEEEEAWKLLEAKITLLK